MIAKWYWLIVLRWHMSELNARMRRSYADRLASEAHRKALHAEDKYNEAWAQIDRVVFDACFVIAVCVIAVFLYFAAH